MPTYNIAVVYQTADAPEILDAIRWSTGLPSNSTTPATLAQLDLTTKKYLVALVQRYRTETAVAAARAGVPPPIVIT